VSFCSSPILAFAALTPLTCSFPFGPSSPSAHTSSPAWASTS
jgi:hypothetical protein